MIVAKAVIPDQYWILREHDRKIGNIEHDSSGYSVRINDQTLRVKTLNMLKQRVDINFENLIAQQYQEPANQVHGYPTSAQPHNAIFDVKHHLPLWTREPRSKSWYAAGWYQVRQHRDWKIVRCPKLIMLERYDYRGPFRSQEEARMAK